MESNNNNGNKDSVYGLGNITEKEPNIEPDEPFLPFDEEREKRERKREQTRIYDRNWRKRRLEKAGKKQKRFNLDHLSPEQKKERHREQCVRAGIENKDRYNENRRIKYALKKAEGQEYIPYEIEEQTSQPVEQASIQTPIYNSG